MFLIGNFMVKYFKRLILIKRQKRIDDNYKSLFVLAHKKLLTSKTHRYFRRPHSRQWSLFRTQEGV